MAKNLLDQKIAVAKLEFKVADKAVRYAARNYLKTQRRLDKLEAWKKRTA